MKTPVLIAQIKSKIQTPVSVFIVMNSLPFSSLAVHVTMVSSVAVSVMLGQVLVVVVHIVVHFPSPLLEIEDVDDVGSPGVVHNFGRIVGRMIGGRGLIMSDEVSAEGAILASAVVIGTRKKRRVLTVKYKKVGEPCCMNGDDEKSNI
jgi:hypothetical protein